MEPIGAVAVSLALGAGTVAGKKLVSALVKDAYARLKVTFTERIASAVAHDDKRTTLA